MSKKQQFEISIDHAMMRCAKAAFNACMKAAIAKAISTGSDEGNATLKISFEIMTTNNADTGEIRRMPVFKYKAGFSVPMKDSLEDTIGESSRIIGDGAGFILVNGQVTMEELMAEEQEP